MYHYVNQSELLTRFWPDLRHQCRIVMDQNGDVSLAKPPTDWAQEKLLYSQANFYSVKRSNALHFHRNGICMGVSHLFFSSAWLLEYLSSCYCTVGWCWRTGITRTAWASWWTGRLLWHYFRKTFLLWHRFSFPVFLAVLAALIETVMSDFIFRALLEKMVPQAFLGHPENRLTITHLNTFR